MKRLSWDQYFMAQSHLLATRSTCTRLVVGATIVRDKRIIAGGYNGSISGGTHCVDDGCYVKDGHCVRTIHAEMNAILQCAKFGEPTDHSEIYVTHYPCLQCCKAIIQAGIQTVYYANDYKNDAYAAELYQMAGVQVKKVPLEKGISLPGQVDNTSKQLDYISELLAKIEANGASGKEICDLQQQAERLFVPDN
ncbi:ComE operon protein 2 [Sporolactobacillus spathodeae]|uniref:ComE operon protein 2 n=1 Tax=Sporolactobacillus spathodeae TaxID=1465502 RepID=A0ABS2Q6F7_9BACL|nr:ComE operon protein 2 [Sporolactobacillus spathodeae]MBM7657363.1 dCMP deaminase [Sporolactobacillus spathodeae]